MKIAELLKPVVAAVVVFGIAYAVYSWYGKPVDDDRGMQRATVSKVQDMVKLCSMEIYDEVPVKGTVGTRHLFGRMLLKASINFDIEDLEVDASGDTLHVILPAEEVQVLESTDDNAYLVIDTWNDRFMGSDTFTTAEENSMKAKVRTNWVHGLYRGGIVARARAEAVDNLGDMLSKLLRRPVVVDDPTPYGSEK